MPMSIAMAGVTSKVRIVDGDTIHIGTSKIRLHGIDAPEARQVAIEWMVALIAAGRPLQTHCASS